MHSCVDITSNGEGFGTPWKIQTVKLPKIDLGPPHDENLQSVYNILWKLNFQQVIIEKIALAHL